MVPDAQASAPQYAYACHKLTQETCTRAATETCMSVQRWPGQVSALRHQPMLPMHATVTCIHARAQRSSS